MFQSGDGGEMARGSAGWPNDNSAAAAAAAAAAAGGEHVAYMFELNAMDTNSAPAHLRERRVAPSRVAPSSPSS